MLRTCCHPSFWPFFLLSLSFLFTPSVDGHNTRPTTSDDNDAHPKNTTDPDLLTRRSTLYRRAPPTLPYMFLSSRYETPTQNPTEHAFLITFERRSDALTPPSPEYLVNQQHAALMFQRLRDHASAQDDQVVPPGQSHYDGTWQPPDTSPRGFRGRLAYNMPTDQYLSWALIGQVAGALAGFLRDAAYQPFDGQVNVRVVPQAHQRAVATMAFWRLRNPPRMPSFEIVGKSIQFFGYRFGDATGEGYVRLPAAPDELR
ncbi:MAG: hypothetical protein M1817_003380 [Caeruleum heppii]|nr:MAG: hypothetical protein M1817_003380 [Caeruleum heppii]